LSILGDIEINELIEKAREAQFLAHAPYSGYRVGAAIQSESGKVYTGANIENASYGATICAERTAIGAMVMGGDKEIVAIAVVTDDEGFPCGICLQAINEFCSDPNLCKIVVPSRGGFQIHTLHELAPSLWRSDFVEKSKKI
jgi:cytidine deaminase